MSGPTFDPMKYADRNPNATEVTSREVTYLGKTTYRFSPGSLTLSPGTKSTPITFNYAGPDGLLIIPYPGIFEPQTPGGSDMLFFLVNGANTLTLKPRQEIQNAGFVVDGSLRFPYSVYNYKEKTFVIGNSPPDMIMGP